MKSRKIEMAEFKARRKERTILAKCPALLSIMLKSDGLTIADIYNLRIAKISYNPKP